MSDLDKRVYMCALKVNVHKCGFSCAKGKSGLRGCRFGFPAPSSIEKTGPCLLSLEGVTMEGWLFNEMFSNIYIPDFCETLGAAVSPV
jgi:hypothetical protein